MVRDDTGHCKQTGAERACVPNPCKADEATDSLASPILGLATHALAWVLHWNHRTRRNHEMEWDIQPH